MSNPSDQSLKVKPPFEYKRRFDDILESTTLKSPLIAKTPKLMSIYENEFLEVKLKFMVLYERSMNLQIMDHQYSYYNPPIYKRPPPDFLGWKISLPNSLRICLQN